ncbi:MAG TPA: prolyl oligopeptidase family serine peptidase [Phycisphaerae bacterium]|nr:prolyl oligopeptidase family serine peptidase [Phycisphaerae bacterium]
MIRGFGAAIVCVAASVCWADQPTTRPSDEIAVSECLVIKPVGRYGRSAVHVDAIEARIVAGTWMTPKEGDTVALPDGTLRTWETAKAGEDGWIRPQGAGGGYASASIASSTERVMLLDASGHSMAYVNGEPRTGDPYEGGYVVLPVLLHQGQNELLFSCGRGGFRAKLTPPSAGAVFNTQDCTLPDFVAGEREKKLGAVIVMNATRQPTTGLAVRAWFKPEDTVVTRLPELLSVSMRKIAFEIPAPAEAAEPGPLSLNLELVRVEGNGDEGKVLDRATVPVRLRKPEQTRKLTFRSSIDGSVQYYALNPAQTGEKSAGAPAMFLTLHGAGVEAIGQADAYAAKSWGHIVAPTNRRPFGFDWEEWGRLDAMEVLDLAAKQLQTDPQRTYLTGHSMGGHGVWQVGATFPDRFAAIAPSAGWISFWSYTGAGRLGDGTPVERMVGRASAPSDTLKLIRNYNRYGVYILHGEKDDNVPVEQARTMVKHLARFHSDFAYYERPGAGHWWGNECVDWPPLFEFLRQHTRVAAKDVLHVAFATASPGVSARCDWASIESQIRFLKTSTIDLRFDPATGAVAGETRNVARLALDLGAFKPAKGEARVSVELDGEKKIEGIPWPAGERLWLGRDGGTWAVQGPPPTTVKRPHRCGLFKDAFRNGVMFVYGTKGRPEENAWAFAKSRYDAEVFWCRGNASVEVLADVDFDRSRSGDRNVILYGNADTNAAWKSLLAASPVQVRRGEVTVDRKKLTGEDLACLFVRPIPDSDEACVGVISGSGPAGMRLTERLPYFLSGVGYPDCTVLGPEMLTGASKGLRGAGFFGNDWSVEGGDFAWAEDQEQAETSEEGG